MVKRTGSFIKRGPTHTFFHSKCNGCAMTQRCISCSSFSSGSREYLLKIQGFEGEPTKAMLDGKVKHEELERGIPRFEEYGVEQFFVDLEAGKQIVLSEVKVCSPLRGLRGVADVLTVQKSGNNYSLNIKDFKPHYSIGYLFQISALGLILSDPDCFISFTCSSKRNPKKKVSKPLTLYRGDPSINITVELSFYKGDSEYQRAFMEKNCALDWAQGIIAAIQKRANSLRRLHKFGTYWLREIPYCKYCPLVDPRFECRYEDHCRPVGYAPPSKSNQAYFGRRRILVKTKPKYTLPINMS